MRLIVLLLLASCATSRAPQAPAPAPAQRHATVIGRAIASVGGSHADADVGNDPKGIAIGLRADVAVRLRDSDIDIGLMVGSRWHDLVVDASSSNPALDVEGAQLVVAPVVRWTSPADRPARPYVEAAVGWHQVSYQVSRRNVELDSVDDHGLFLMAGAGLMFPLGDRGASLQLGAAYERGELNDSDSVLEQIGPQIGGQFRF